MGASPLCRSNLVPKTLQVPRNSRASTEAPGPRRDWRLGVMMVMPWSQDATMDGTNYDRWIWIDLTSWWFQTHLKHIKYVIYSQIRSSFQVEVQIKHHHLLKWNPKVDCVETEFPFQKGWFSGFMVVLGVHLWHDVSSESGWKIFCPWYVWSFGDDCLMNL